MLKTAAAMSLIFLVACTNPAPEPDPKPSRYDECALLCSDIDTDLLSLPANQCPGPDDDTSYMRCLGECVAQMPAGNWCFPP